MRIVEYGYIKPKEVKCNHCGAILEYLPCDLQPWKIHSYYLICPVCIGRITTDNNGNYFTIEDFKR